MRKAYLACQQSGINPSDHFVVINEMVPIGSGAEREAVTVLLSRYASYITVQNADSSKSIVAQAQTYFAIQTRRAELFLDNKLSSEDEKRLMLRDEMKTHNIQLASAAKDAGVTSNKDYGIFQNFDYKGLYGGLSRDDIHKRKGLNKNQQILDHMGSTELAANLFRATQTEEKLRKVNIKDKSRANRIHMEVGKKVRQTIKEIGGTMPENLPSIESIKKLELKRKRMIEKQNKLDSENNK